MKCHKEIIKAETVNATWTAVNMGSATVMKLGSSDALAILALWNQRTKADNQLRPLGKSKQMNGGINVVLVTFFRHRR